MSQLLTVILNRAVPDVCVKRAKLDGGDLFYILVQPAHSRYWSRFKKKYSYCVRLALEYDAEVFGGYCPEFRSPRLLIDWLSEVLSLTEGERKLLLLDMGLWGSLGF